jgi:DNA replication protein DnaC
VTQLLEERETGKLERLQKQIERFDLLVLDELGCVPFSKAGAVSNEEHSKTRRKPRVSA